MPNQAYALILLHIMAGLWSLLIPLPRFVSGLTPLPSDFGECDNNKNTHPIGWVFLLLVEMGGVEPPSESTLTETSPGADGHLHSLT